MLTCSCYNSDSIGTHAPRSVNPAKVIKRFCFGWYRLQAWTLVCGTTVKHCDENTKLLSTHSSGLHLRTYRKCVCAIVLPHLQQGHHHFMEFISRQNPITVHIEHFEANCWWKEGDARNILLVSSTQKPTGTLFLVWRSNVFPFLKYISNFKVQWQCWGRKEPNDTLQEHFHIHSYKAEIDCNCHDKNDLVWLGEVSGIYLSETISKNIMAYISAFQQ